MEFIDGIKESFARRLAPTVSRFYASRLNEAHNQIDYLQESVSTISLEMENLQYQKLSNFAPEQKYAPDHVRGIVKLAVQMALKNPITVRSVNVQADYVFGQGVSFVAKHPAIQAVIDEFVNYRENRNSLTSHTAMLRQEKRQQVYGSIFLVLNTNPRTGRVIVRNLPTLEVGDIITDPDDRDKEWFIKHCYYQAGKEVTIYHPAYGIDIDSQVTKPWDLPYVAGETPHAQGDILWDAPVLHVAANRLGQEKFAIPEVYPQLDWALAYKRTLEQWISIIASYARMAMKITGLSGKKQAAAAKALINTRTSLSQGNETNPSATSGSTALMGMGKDIEPIKTAGATTSADEAAPILNFAGCAVGLPNTFYGDAGKGNFATAKTLDRPTELKMISRQKLWMEIFNDILAYVIRQAVIAEEGILRGIGASAKEAADVFTNEIHLVTTMPTNTDEQFGAVGEPIDASFEVHFPEVLERNVADRVRSLVNAATLFGKPLTDIIPDKRLVAKLLLQALNVPNAESYIPAFVEMWGKNMDAEPGQAVEAHIIPPPLEKNGGGFGAEDAAQGGLVGDNG